MQYTTRFQYCSSYYRTPCPSFRIHLHIDIHSTLFSDITLVNHFS